MKWFAIAWFQKRYLRWWLAESFLHAGKPDPKHYNFHDGNGLILRKDWDPYTNPAHLDLVKAIAKRLRLEVDFSNPDRAFKEIHDAME